MKLHSPGAILLILCLSWLATESLAADKPWLRYDNPHFTAYSNASDKQTRQLLEDLETFRAAFLQIGNVEVPAAVPKPIVLIMAEQKAYLKLAPGRNTAGFALGAEGKTFIVMPAAGGKKWSSTVIRHEYGHILLHYKKYPYPNWYEEGFSELVSSMELTNKGKSFVIGKPPDRAKQGGWPMMAWDELVSEEFDPHNITNPMLGSSAYAQAWLLAHYATLGDDFRNARKLQKYFDLLNEGAGSIAAFEEAFGVAPDDLWANELEAYVRRVASYTFQYRPGAVQTEFSQVPADDGEILPVLEYLTFRGRAVQKTDVPKDPLGALPGNWAPLSLDGKCESSTRISVDRSAATITVETDRRDDAETETTTFNFKPHGNGVFTLALPADPAGDDSPGDTVGLNVRSPDLFCWGETEGGRVACAVLMRKCGG